MSLVATSVGVGALLTYGLYRRFSRGMLLPKHFKDYDDFKDDLILQPGAVNRNPYHPDKVPKNLDAIVIGSNLASLTTAALLAKIGWKVLVVDNAQVAGGSHLDDTYSLLKLELGFEMTEEILKLVMNQPVEWDHVSMRDHISNGYKNLSQESAVFLNKYLNEIQRTSRFRANFFFFKVLKPIWLRRWLIDRMFTLGNEGWLVDKNFSQLSQLTVAQVLTNKIGISDPDLMESVRQQFVNERYLQSNLGLCDLQASFWLHALTVNQYMNDKTSPKVDSNDEIVNQIIPTIEKAGGRVLIWNGVKEIIIEQEDKSIWNLWGWKSSQARVVGVVMANDELEIRAPVVISGVGLNETYGQLLPQEVVEQYCGWKKLQESGVVSFYSHPGRFDPKISRYLEPETGISGLYLTGKTVTIPGLHGALISGLLTASSILGYGTVLDAFRGRSLVKDLSHLA